MWGLRSDALVDFALPLTLSLSSSLNLSLPFLCDQPPPTPPDPPWRVRSTLCQLPLLGPSAVTPSHLPHCWLASSTFPCVFLSAPACAKGLAGRVSGRLVREFAASAAVGVPEGRGGGHHPAWAERSGWPEEQARS